MAESGFVLNAIRGAFSTCDKTFIIEQQKHRALNKSRAFKMSFTSSATTDTTTLYMQINGSSNSDLFITAFDTYISNGFTDLKLIKISTSSTHTNGTNQLTPYNKNNGSTIASNATFFNDPTDVSSTESGNYIADRFQIGVTNVASPFSASGSAISESEEAFIISNSTYIIQIDVSTTEVTCWFTGRLSYYEHNGW